MADYLKMLIFDLHSEKTKHFLVYYTVIIIILSVERIMLAPLCLIGSLYSAMTFSGIFAEHESKHTDPLYDSVPFDIKDIVLGRYLYILLKYLACLAITLAVPLLAAKYGRGPMFTANLAMVSFSISLLMFSIFIGIETPLLFYFGYEKMKPLIYAPHILIFTLLLIPPLRSVLAKKIALILMRINLTAPEIIVGGLLLSCLFLFISYNVSVSLCRKRKEEGK